MFIIIKIIRCPLSFFSELQYYLRLNQFKYFATVKARLLIFSSCMQIHKKYFRSLARLYIVGVLCTSDMTSETLCRFWLLCCPVVLWAPVSRIWTWRIDWALPCPTPASPSPSPPSQTLSPSGWGPPPVYLPSGATHISLSSLYLDYCFWSNERKEFFLGILFR